MNILLIRPGALGDTLMLAPSLSLLAPGTRTLLVGRRPGIELLGDLAGPVMDYEAPPWHGLFVRDGASAIRSLHPAPDLALAFLSDPEGIAVQNLRGAFLDAGVWQFPPFPPREEVCHVALYMARCLERAGAPLRAEGLLEHAGDRPLLSVPFSREKGAMVLLHPGSGSPRKNLPFSFWLKLHGRLSAHLPPGHDIHWVIGPAEAQLLPRLKTHSAARPPRILLNPDMGKLASLLRSAALYIGHDSGVTHLAALVGTPTIALYKNACPARWSPLGPRVRVLAEPLDIQGLQGAVLVEAMRFLGRP